MLVKCSTHPMPSGLLRHAGLQVRLGGVPVLDDAAVPEGAVPEAEDVDEGRVTTGVSAAHPAVRDDEVATRERPLGTPAEALRCPQRVAKADRRRPRSRAAPMASEDRHSGGIPRSSRLRFRCDRRSSFRHRSLTDELIRQDWISLPRMVAKAS